MNRFTMSNVLIAICIAGCISLAFFFTFAGKKWTLVKTQIVVLFVANIATNISLCIRYRYLDVLALKVFASFFVNLTAVTYLIHSWTRAESILSFQNQFLFQICNYFIWFSPILFQIPTIIAGVGTVTDTSKLFSLVIAILYIIAFLFDSFMLYKFIGFFNGEKNKINSKPKIIAKYGIMAMVSIILSFFSFLLYTVNGDGGYGESASNVWLLVSQFFILFAIVIFVKMKWELKEDTAKNSNSNSNPKNKLNPVKPEGISTLSQSIIN